jgi:hypothetical protein
LTLGELSAISRGMFSVEALKLVTETFMKATGISGRAISERAGLNDKFVAHVLQLRGLQTAKGDRLLAWLSENWPSDVEWPSGISRPEIVRR